MKGYLDAIPKDLDESARMDGASSFRIFFEIIMPLSKPILAVVALFSFTGPLGDFILSSTILRTPDKYTLPIGLYNLVAQNGRQLHHLRGRRGADCRSGCDSLRHYKILCFRPDLWQYKG